MSAQRIDIQAGFSEGEKPAFFVRFSPVDVVPRAHVIYLPPFTEEMNRCRAIAAGQARWFARQGISCTLLDFHGTGESPGETTDATLPIWYNNISEIYDSLVNEAQVPVHLWGCRLGALIAANYLAERTITCDALLMWQPVVSGKAYATQVYRQRLAALIERGGAAETTTTIRERLANGDNVEIGGYSLGGDLMLSIDSLDMADIPRAPAKRIYWLEHSSDGDQPPNPRSAKAISHLSGLGAETQHVPFSGAPIWQLHERATCDSLLEKTEALPL
ncbi:MAG: alpha/beta hydrolase [Halieaceae bacterium]|uniref:serine aminopeptidase domain-containing protein n=1 Tax=Haliea alexandrii TaxID=2448162 RepID=UPI000F0B96F2|nr:alpha/beta hydrolase [Haliea alexandrii]MCR9186209.1 alpha/beta hydrolase [Halieaceae bacterium]